MRYEETEGLIKRLEDGSIHLVNSSPLFLEEHVAYGHTDTERRQMSPRHVADQVHVLVEMVRIHIDEQRDRCQLVDIENSANRDDRHGRPGEQKNESGRRVPVMNTSVITRYSPRQGDICLKMA